MPFKKTLSINISPILLIFILFLISICLYLLTACTSRPGSATESQDGPPTYDIDVSKIPNAVPKVEPKSHLGNPSSYTVNGSRYYVMKTNKNYHATGIASWYGTKFHDHLTSDGEHYNMYEMTAAHRTLPIPTYLRVTNLENGNRIIVKVNDRGPFENNRLLDLSYVAAKKLGIADKGTGLVEIDSINPSKLKTTSINSLKVSKNKKPEIYLQIGVYSSLSNALYMKERVVANVSTTSTIHVYSEQSTKHKLYHLQIGPIADVETADQISEDIVRSGLPEPMTIIKEISTKTKKSLA